MKPGIRYIVTKGSDDGTFEIGDKISMDKDGYIILHAGAEGGWIDKEDIPEATMGIGYEVDKEWLDRKKKEYDMLINMAKDADIGIEPMQSGL